MKILFVIYDNEGPRNILPLGTAYVASYLRKYGYKDLHFYNQDVYHYPETHLTEYISKNRFDIVALGFVAGYFQYRKIIMLCDAINKSKHRPIVVLGGHGPSSVPEFWMEKTNADMVVIGEGEVPFLNLVKALDHKESLSGVKGIAYRDGNKIVVNERERPILKLDTIPFPYYDHFPMEYYVNGNFYHLGMDKLDRYIGMITSRGCAYSCNFCQRLEKGYRFRSPNNIIEELKKVIKDYNISFVIFWDELFMVSEKQITELCERIIKESIKIRYWCAGRFDKVNPKILRLMKRSGCVYIDYGIEQFDDAALKAMNKKLTEEEIIKGIEMTQKEGIHVAFNLIFGNVGDTKESLYKSATLLKKYNDYRQLRVMRPVTPYPGTPLYDLCIEKGWLKNPEDFYNKHRNLENLTVNFTNIPDDEYYKLLFDVNKQIIKDYHDYHAAEIIENFKKVYFEGDLSYRGARHQ